MPWSTGHTRKVMKVTETPQGRGVTGEILVTVYDNGLIEVCGTPAGRRYGDERLPAGGRHDETNVVQDITSCLLELYRQADAHRALRAADGLSKAK